MSPIRSSTPLAPSLHPNRECTRRDANRNLKFTTETQRTRSSTETFSRVFLGDLSDEFVSYIRVHSRLVCRLVRFFLSCAVSPFRCLLPFRSNLKRYRRVL